jgi:hypothetical protein
MHHSKQMSKMKKLLGIIILYLLLSGNAFAKPMNFWIALGYKVENEDLLQEKSLKVFTLMNNHGYVVICTIKIKSPNGTIADAKCKEQ